MSDNVNWLSKDFDNARDYWNKSFTNVNTDSVVQCNKSGCEEVIQGQLWELSQEVSGKIDTYCNNQEVSIFIWFCTVTEIMMHKITNKETVTIVSAVIDQEDQGINNSIVFNEKVDGNLTFKQMLMQVRGNILEAYKYQYYPLKLICETVGIELAETRHIRVEYNKFNQNKAMYEADYELFFEFDRTDEGRYTIRVSYQSSKFPENYIEKLTVILNHLITASVTDANCMVRNMELMDENEVVLLLEECCKGNSINWQYKTLINAFEHIVMSYPEGIALVQGKYSVTYSQLNQLSDRIAFQLQSIGMAKNDIVALYGDSSIEVVISMLAAMKAGGCYLPIDTESPIERVEYILADSKAKFLLTCKRDLCQMIKFDGKVLSYEELITCKYDGKADITLNEGDQAYVIYTSGTTGNPKGVVITHKGICNYIFWRIMQYRVTETDVTLQLLSIAFDGYCSNLYTSILSGGKLVLPKTERMKDYKYISDLIVEQEVNGFSCVPTIYQAVLGNMENGCYRLRYVVLAGERTPLKLVEESKQRMPMTQLINEYGPTENSVATTYLMNIKDNNIGSPIANEIVLILNDDGNMLPRGFKGELCVAGAGLAKGYLNQTELTEKKFVATKYLPGKKIYHTGDFACWNLQNKIELYGRTDRQIKMNGHRIELEEIEKVLSSYDAIKYSAVIVKKNELGMHFEAFYTADVELGRKELRNHMKEYLPEYMIPSQYRHVDDFLMVNGKADLKKLEHLIFDDLKENQIVQPKTEIEKNIYEVWVKVLKKSDFGIKHNFFTLGGDSISTIQVASLLRNQGIKIQPQDIFEFPTIKELSMHTVQFINQSDQIQEKKRAKLTPIQKWFFESTIQKKNYFIQSVVLKSERFELEVVQSVLSQLYKRHDAFRLKYNFVDNSIEQESIPFAENLINIKLYNAPSDINIEEYVKERKQKFADEFDIYEGRLTIAAVIRTQKEDYLVFMIHHLAVDVVSWRILLEEFNEIYKACLENRKCDFYRTTSFITYANMLNSKEMIDCLWYDRKYWTQIGEMVNKKVSPRIISTYDEMESLDFECSNGITELLLTDANNAYTTDCRDLILTALGEATKQLIGRNSIVVEVEGHGREDIIENLDIVKTVGWFTTKYPILLNLAKEDDIAYDICSVKESVQQVPNKGLGYGIIKYLDDKNELADIKSDISFNYLGQFTVDESSFIQMTNISQGLQMDGDELMLNHIDVIALISDGKLHVSVKYGRRDYTKNDMEKFTSQFQNRLESIVKYCIHQKDKIRTQSDYGCMDLSKDELENVLNLILSLHNENSDLLL